MNIYIVSAVDARWGSWRDQQDFFNNIGFRIGLLRQSGFNILGPKKPEKVSGVARLGEFIAPPADTDWDPEIVACFKKSDLIIAFGDGPSVGLGATIEELRGVHPKSARVFVHVVDQNWRGGVPDNGSLHCTPQELIGYRDWDHFIELLTRFVEENTCQEVAVI